MRHPCVYLPYLVVFIVYMFYTSPLFITKWNTYTLTDGEYGSCVVTGYDTEVMFDENKNNHRCIPIMNIDYKFRGNIYHSKTKSFEYPDVHGGIVYNQMTDIEKKDCIDHLTIDGVYVGKDIGNCYVTYHHKQINNVCRISVDNSLEDIDNGNCQGGILDPGLISFTNFMLVGNTIVSIIFLIVLIKTDVQNNNPTTKQLYGRLKIILMMTMYIVNSIAITYACLNNTYGKVHKNSCVVSGHGTNISKHVANDIDIYTIIPYIYVNYKDTYETYLRRKTNLYEFNNKHNAYSSNNLTNIILKSNNFLREKYEMGKILNDCYVTPYKRDVECVCRYYNDINNGCCDDGFYDRTITALIIIFIIIACIFIAMMMFVSYVDFTIDLKAYVNHKYPITLTRYSRVTNSDEEHADIYDNVEIHPKFTQIYKTDMCAICDNNTANVIILPCGHCAICKECALLLDNVSSKCPICCEQITTFVYHKDDD